MPKDRGQEIELAPLPTPIGLVAYKDSTDVVDIDSGDVIGSLPKQDQFSAVARIQRGGDSYLINQYNYQNGNHVGVLESDLCKPGEVPAGEPQTIADLQEGESIEVTFKKQAPEEKPVEQNKRRSLGQRVKSKVVKTFKRGK